VFVPLPPSARIIFRLLAFLTAIAFGSAIAYTQPSAETSPKNTFPPVGERGTLVVGAFADSYPYSYLDSKGQLVGFAVDLLDAVARTMNLKIKRVALPGGKLQQEFRQGKFDFLQLLSQTNEREKYAEFSVPALTLQGAIFVRRGNPAIRSIEDFNGRKFAVIGPNSIAEDFLRDHSLKVEKVYASSTADGVQLVASGECAGVFASQLTTLSVIDRKGFKDVVMFQQPVANYDIRHCFAVHRGDAQLLARLNEGLAILHRNGEYDQINHRWFGQFDSPLISRQQVINYGAGILALGLIAAVAGLLRQRALRRHIAGQAAELAGQQALLRTLYDNIPLAMCVLRSVPSGGYQILSINRQAENYFNLAAEQAAGRLLFEISPDSDWVKQLGELLQRGLTVQSYLREERVLAGARKRLIFTLVPMTPDTAGNARLCVLAEDITERRNLDEEIAQSRKLRAVGELVGGIAHEFNNLLTPIMLKVGQIELDWSHDSALLAELRLIAEAVQRSSELTRRLLTFGRKADQRAEQLTLATVVNNCFALLRLTMDRRIQWQQAIPANLPPLYFSATDLNQIILNLVINARDTLLEKLNLPHGDWIPCIRVEATEIEVESIGPIDPTRSHRQVHGWQRLSIRDNGMGMTHDVKERIFEPFFTTKDVGQGTGLGLATVWHLVTAASGRIEVESVRGEGTVFHVYLPMLAVPTAVAPHSPALPAAKAGPARILLADDDLLVAGAVTAALKRAGHAVTHFPDGAIAWQFLQDHPDDFDLLILDVNMPGMDGIELAGRIRASGLYKGKMIIASGRLGSDDLEEIAKARVDCVLNKPFDIAELLGTVGNCLAG
jgi:signal transduction histidine kinase/ABC-type amino acid transport substrate-binding protein/CheY-like chemotaxis protein